RAAERGEAAQELWLLTEQEDAGLRDVLRVVQLQLLLGCADAQGQGSRGMAAQDAGDGRRPHRARLVAPRMAHLPRQTLFVRVGHHRKFLRIVVASRSSPRWPLSQNATRSLSSTSSVGGVCSRRLRFFANASSTSSGLIRSPDASLLRNESAAGTPTMPAMTLTWTSSSWAIGATSFDTFTQAR